MAITPFDRIVTRHGPTVYRVCRALLSRVDAEDAWSETFLSALRAYPGLDGDSNVQAWLVTIAHRKAIDITRRRRREPTPVEQLPERQYQDRTPQDDELWAALARLPDKQRHAVAFHYLAGLPHQEIAEVLGGSAEAARRAAADGIKSLRRNLLAHNFSRKGEQS